MLDSSTSPGRRAGFNFSPAELLTDFQNGLDGAGVGCQPFRKALASFGLPEMVDVEDCIAAAEDRVSTAIMSLIHDRKAA